MSAEARRCVTSRATLYYQNRLTLKHWYHRLVARYGEAARVDPESLRHYFLEAGISFRQPLRSLATSLSESQLRNRQVEFLYYLMNFIHCGTKI